MHVCGLILLDASTVPGGYSFESMKADLERRVRPIPMFHRKLRLVPGRLDHPVWVEDVDFDIDRHVHRAALPAPGGDQELSELCGHIAGIPLDRSRPLWEMWIIEGLASGQVAVFSKMHHASVDGASGSNMISHLCSLEAGSPPLDLDGAAPDMRVPGDLELVARALGNNLAKPVQLLKMVAPTAGILGTSVRRAREGTAMAAPLTAPRTSFNGTITGHRAVAWSDMSLERIKEIRKRVEGATINDVVLAVSGGALRRYLEDRGELPVASLLASVPVSVRSESTKPGSNQVSSLFTRLRTDLADPRERIQAIARSNIDAKEHHKAIPADTLQDWAQFAAPRVFGVAMRAVAGLRLADRGPVIHNLVISNVPGPPVPLYFMGARMDALYPLGPVFHGAALNITVLSNNGVMHVGVIACRESMPRVWDLADDFPRELDAMYAAIVG
jgi:diacylglycerol O-acyltransferase